MLGPSVKNDRNSRSVSSTVSLSLSCVSCSCTPRRDGVRRGRSATAAPACGPRRHPARPVPPRISMVVVFPAPLGPSKPKHSPLGDLEVQPIDGDDVGIAFDEAAARDRGGRGMHPSHSMQAGRLVYTLQVVSAIVLIGPREALAKLRQQLATETKSRTFTDHEVREAVEFIATARPAIVAIEEAFAVSARGEALIGRITDDPGAHGVRCPRAVTRAPHASRRGAPCIW